ncbi:hypothetical protein PQX77_011872 [Marasmius sp. AFHP31]|nr:hypothetical protein PQX77_011872 [Marasmius sp. AFHP31]
MSSPSPPISTPEMTDSRPVTPFHSTQNVSSLANAQLHVAGSANMSAITGNQYNYHSGASPVLSSRSDNHVEHGNLVGPEHNRLQETLKGVRFSYHFRRQTFAPETRPPGLSEAKVIEELKAWALSYIDNDGETPRVCWLRGPPNTGKSVMATTAARLWDDQNELAASFFFDRKVYALRRPKYLALAIADGLASTNDDLRGLIFNAIQTKPFILDAAFDIQFQQLVARPLQQLQEAGIPARPMLVLIDGLDACKHSHHLTEVFSVVASALRDNLPLRFLISSRSEDDLWDLFSDPKLAPFTKFLLLNGDPTANQHVRDILTNGFHKLRSSEAFQDREIPSSWPSTRDIETLVEKASGQTEYANTLIRFLENHSSPKKQLQEILKLKPDDSLPSLPPSLCSLYEHILRSALEDNESREAVIFAIAFLHNNPRLIPHHLITQRFLETLRWRGLKFKSRVIAKDLDALRSCLRFGDPDDELVAYDPLFFRFLLEIDEDEETDNCSDLLAAWFDTIEFLYEEEKDVYTEKTEKIYDAVLLGWPAFRFVKGLQSEFIQEMIDLDFIELFEYLLKRSWNPPAKASEQAKHIGISVLYKQTGELIPWFKELIDDDPDDSDDDASVNSPPPSSVVDSDDSDPEVPDKATLKGHPEAEKNAVTLLRVFKSSHSSFCISPPDAFMIAK